MDRLIAEFKALSKEAQGQLKQQFPVFGMLDEVRYDIFYCMKGFTIKNRISSSQVRSQQSD